MAGELGFVIITHGDLGGELLKVASHILGAKLGSFACVRVPFMPEMIDRELTGSAAPFRDRRQWLEEKVREAAAEVDSGAGLIVFTDILGGTAFNVAQQLLGNRRAAIIAGINLPMLLKIPSVKGLPLEGAVQELVERSRQAIVSRQTKSRA